MAKLTTPNLTSLANQTSAINTINLNFDAVDTAMENTLSRDGTFPNTMGAALDMNSNRIMNLPAPLNDLEAANKFYVDTAVASVGGEGAPSSGQLGYVLTGNDLSTPATFRGFIQSGTGALTQTWQNKMRQQISVLDFIPVDLHEGIAARTETSDLYLYILAGINEVAAQGGGYLYFPPGDYYYETPIVITDNNVFLIGAGRGSENIALPGATSLRYQGGASNHGAVTFGDGTTPLVGGGVSHMRIYGGQASQKVIHLNTASWTKHEYCTFLLPADNGYICRLDSADIAGSNNCGNNSFQFCSFVGQNPGVTALSLVPLSVSGVHEQAASRNSWYGCDFFWANDTSTSYGVQLGHCDSNVWVLCDWQPNGGETSGYPVFGGPCDSASFPSGNSFYHCFPESSDFTRIFGGTFASARNTFFGWDDQVTIPDKAGLVFFTNQGKTWVDGDLVSMYRVADSELGVKIGSTQIVDYTVDTTQFLQSTILQTLDHNDLNTLRVNNGSTGSSAGARLRLTSGTAADFLVDTSHVNGGSFAAELLGNLYFQTNTAAKKIVFRSNGAGSDNLTINGSGDTIVGSTFKLGVGNTSPNNLLDVAGSFGRVAPVTETNATHTLAATTTHLIANRAGTITVTLPTASSWTGREVYIKTIQAQTVVSNSSDVVPSTSASAGTAILPATDGAWAFLVSDGSNWVIMAAYPLV